MYLPNPPIDMAKDPKNLDPRKGGKDCSSVSLPTAENGDKTVVQGVVGQPKSSIQPMCLVRFRSSLPALRICLTSQLGPVEWNFPPKFACDVSLGTCLTSISVLAEQTGKVTHECLPYKTRLPPRPSAGNGAYPCSIHAACCRGDHGQRGRDRNLRKACKLSHEMRRHTHS